MIIPVSLGWRCCSDWLFCWFCWLELWSSFGATIGTRYCTSTSLFMPLSICSAQCSSVTEFITSLLSSGCWILAVAAAISSIVTIWLICWDLRGLKMFLSNRFLSLNNKNKEIIYRRLFPFFRYVLLLSCTFLATNCRVTIPFPFGVICRGLVSPRLAIAQRCPAPWGAFDPFRKWGFIDKLWRTEFFQRSSLLL